MVVVGNGGLNSKFFSAHYAFFRGGSHTCIIMVGRVCVAHM